jgi:glycosyltransferase involved in cell wall biosynthesis
MRILHIIQKKQLRGAEVFASQLSEHLVRQGHEVKIVALLDGDAILPFSGDIEVLGAKLKKRFWDFGSWKKLAIIVDSFRPDVVQANAGDTLKYAIFSKWLYRWKQPVVFRNASTISSYAKSFFSKRLIRFLLSRTKSIISVSAFTRNDLSSHFGVPEHKSEVIPIGIEEKQPHPIAAMQNRCINLVHVGGFSFEKNHKGLLRIFSETKKTHANLKLWLVGDGPLRQETAAYAASLGLEQDICFTGFVNNPLDYINSADLLLLPSIIEGLPGVILEAFYCKTPVIAYNVGGIGDLLSEGNTGFLIASGNESAFSAAISQYIGLADTEKAIIIRNANQLVLQQYTNAVIAKRFLAAYTKLT